jgi:flagellar protein FlaG
MNTLDNQSNVVPAKTLGTIQNSSVQSTQASTTLSDKDVVSKVVSVEIKLADLEKTSKPTKEAIAKAAEDIQNFVNDMGRNLNFSIDETTGYNVVRVVNPETNELIRQLPSEELLKIARNMRDLGNVLVNQKA